MFQQTGSQDTAAAKVVEKLEQMCAPKKDTYFFHGNIASHPTNFTIVGIWWPNKKEEVPQLGLFGQN